MKLFYSMLLLLALSFCAVAQAPTLDADQDQLESLDSLHQDKLIAQHIPDYHPQHYEAFPQKMSTAQFGSNPWEYGIVGVMVFGMMSMLWYMVKSDRTDRKSLTDAISALQNSIDAQRRSNDKLALEMRAFSESMKERIDGMEQKMNQLITLQGRD